MRLLKPNWVSHDGNPIFSVDIHPDASRFATGGQAGDGTGRVVIWNMAPVRDEDAELDDSTPKVLCQMDNHLSCVNCVRWSNNGKYLASGGDDKSIIIWQTSRYSGPSTVFGSGGSVVNVEQWRCVATLQGHSGDILDLNWSPHDAWLASCSIDNTIVIWNGLKFPEQLAVLKGHTGMVKGVTWDPVGKYIASQSDDRTLRVWRTLDWQQETSITEPFQECGGTTHVLRLSWSPDGQYIVSAHAMNNSGPTAQIVERSGWKANLDFVGHRKAITVVRFNPKILRKKIKKTNDKPQQYSCCAIGSRDRSLSVWLTALKRPLVVMHDLFSNSVLDISWSRSGFELLCCSVDGTVAYLDFTEEEIGKPLSKEETATLHKETYGKSLAVSSSSSAPNQIIETAAMLNLQQQQEQQQQLEKQKSQQAAAKKMASGEGTMGPPRNKQIETITKDGKRRITPIFLAPQPDFGDTPLPFDASSNNTILSTSSTEPSKIIIEHKETNGLKSPELNQSLTSLGSEPVQSSTPDRPSNGQDKQPNEETPVASKDEEVVKDSGFAALTEKEAEKEPPKHVQEATPDRSSEKTKHLSSDRETPSKLSLKRKHVTYDAEGHPIVRKRGRPPKNRDGQSNRVTTLTTQASTPQVSSHTQHHHSPQVERIVYSPGTLQLPVPSIDKTASVQISGNINRDSALTLEVENGISVGHTCIHKLRCSRKADVHWETVLTSKIIAVTGNKYYACAACADGTISVYGSSGRRMFPAMMMDSKVSILRCTGHYLMAISSKGCLYVWNLKKQCVVIKNESLITIIPSSDVSIERTSLTDRGLPLISLTNGKAYTYSQDLGCWSLLANKDDCLFLCSDFQSCVSSADVFNQQGSLSALQSHKQRGGNQATRLFRSNPLMQQASTVSHIESQMVSSLAMKSSGEYKFWLMTYMRYLVQEGFEERLRDVCDELLGPTHGSKSQVKWEPTVLGHQKQFLLREVLPIIGSNLRFQRLFTEYQEQLDSHS